MRIDKLCDHKFSTSDVDVSREARATTMRHEMLRRNRRDRATRSPGESRDARPRAQRLTRSACRSHRRVRVSKVSSIERLSQTKSIS